MIGYRKIQYSSINEIAALKVKTSTITFNIGKEREGKRRDIEGKRS